MHFKLQSTSDAWAMLSPLIGALKALTHMCTHMHIHRVYIYMTLWHTLIARHLHEAIWFAKRWKTSCPKTSLWVFSDCDTVNPNLLRVMTQGEKNKTIEWKVCLSECKITHEDFCNSCNSCVIVGGLVTEVGGNLTNQRVGKTSITK